MLLLLLLLSSNLLLQLQRAFNNRFLSHWRHTDTHTHTIHSLVFFYECSRKKKKVAVLFAFAYYTLLLLFNLFFFFYVCFLLGFFLASFDCFPFNTSVHWRVRIRFDNGRCGEKKWKQRLRQRRRRRRCNSSSSSSTLAVSLCVCVRAFCALVYVWRAGSLSIEGLCGDGDVARKIQYK